MGNENLIRGVGPLWKESVWSFMRLHIPSGERSEGKTATMTREDFFELLGRWNAQQPGIWQYWESDYRSNRA